MDNELKEPVKAKFKKITNGVIHETHGYYVSEKDFNNRNCTLIFINLTNKTKPIPKKKKVK